MVHDLFTGYHHLLLQWGMKCPPLFVYYIAQAKMDDLEQAKAEAGGRVRDYLLDRLREQTGEDYSHIEDDTELAAKVYAHNNPDEDEDQEDPVEAQSLDELLAEMDRVILPPERGVLFTGTESDHKEEVPLYWTGELSTELWLKWASQSSRL